MTIKRKILQLSVPIATGLCAIVSCCLFSVILYSIIVRGWSAVSIRFFTEQIRLVGADGGIFNNIVGTAILLVTAFLASFPLVVSLALIYTTSLRYSIFRGSFYLLLYILNGVPSILFGLFGMIVFVGYFSMGKSWLTGGFLLGFMILPTVTVALVERILALPSSQVEAAFATGMNKTQVIRFVIIPQSSAGLVTGYLLGLARAAGETAPIMFTATVFAGATFPQAIKNSPVLTLPYHIFVLAQDSFDPAVGAKLWGTALTLLALVSAMSFMAMPFRLFLTQPERNE